MNSYLEFQNILKREKYLSNQRKKRKILKEKKENRKKWYMFKEIKEQDDFIKYLSK